MNSKKTDVDEIIEQKTRGGEILVVDDDVTLLKTIRKVLEKVGFDVTTAKSGAEAMEFVKARDFDIIVMDIRMPDMNGISLLRRIRYSRDMDSRIIIMTAYASEESSIQAMELDANAYIKKPFELSEFLSCIKKNIVALRLKQEQKEFRRKFLEDRVREGDELKERLSEVDGKYTELLGAVSQALKSKSDADLRKKLRKVLADQKRK